MYSILSHPTLLNGNPSLSFHVFCSAVSQVLYIHLVSRILRYFHWKIRQKRLKKIDFGQWKKYQKCEPGDWFRDKKLWKIIHHFHGLRLFAFMPTGVHKNHSHDHLSELSQLHQRQKTTFTPNSDVKRCERVLISRRKCVCLKPPI